jgi:hypothetical protein
MAEHELKWWLPIQSGAMDNKKIIQFPNEIPKGTLCANCGKPYADSWWVGEGNSFSAIHGQAAPWCTLCTLEAQLAYATSCAERIPRIKAELEEEIRVRVDLAVEEE